MVQNIICPEKLVDALYLLVTNKCGCGGMVDAADSKSASGDRVGVQVPSAVPTRIVSEY